MREVEGGREGEIEGHSRSSHTDHYQQKTTIVANRIIILFKVVLRKSSVTKVIQYKLEYNNLTITIMCDLLYRFV